MVMDMNKQEWMDSRSKQESKKSTFEGMVLFKASNLKGSYL